MRQFYYTLQVLLHERGSNCIKLVSLTLGLLVGLLLFSQVAFELSYEDFYREPDRVVVMRVQRQKDGVATGKYDYDVFRPAAADLWEALPELVESASISANFWTPALYVEGKKLDDVQVMFADTLYFQTIGLEVLRGNPADLAVGQNLFLSQSKARELFGDEDPLGKVISVDKLFDATVRGIYKDVPGNTVYPHNMVFSITAFEWFFGRGTWNTNDLYNVLFRLKRPEDVESMNRQVQQAVKRYSETRQGETELTYSVLPIRKLHISQSDSIRRLVILGILGFSIFFVSVMNYVLAAIASMKRRAKAVGVYKCNGAGGNQVLGMFLFETALLVLASTAGALLLIYLFADSIEEMLGTRLHDLFTWHTLYVPLLMVAVLFVVAGVLPGRMYARIPVTQVFRHYTDGKRSWKQGLLFVQFAGVAFVLGILLTAVVQYRDLMRRDIGFQSEALVTGTLTGKVENLDLDNVADALRRQPYVAEVVCSSISLLAHYSTCPLTSTDGTFLAPLHYMCVDKEFPQAIGMTLLEGNWPRHDGEAVIGRQTVETMKWQTNAIGRKLPMNPKHLGLEEPATVVGVVEDVRNMGFFMDQTCTAFIQSNHLRTFNVQLKEPVDENLKRLNGFAKETWADKSFEFTAYSDIRREMNASVHRFRNVVYITSLCILLIVLTGLIGYVSDETQRRSKEIAIRKVNGSEASGILRLLSADILKVAVGAVVGGMAFAWYVSGIWLKQFSDSALPSPLWFFLLIFGLLLFIVLIVVAKAWGIANENPVKSLKSE